MKIPRYRSLTDKLILDIAFRTVSLKKAKHTKTKRGSASSLAKRFPIQQRSVEKVPRLSKKAIVFLFREWKETGGRA